MAEAPAREYVPEKVTELDLMRAKRSLGEQRIEVDAPYDIFAVYGLAEVVASLRAPLVRKKLREAQQDRDEYMAYTDDLTTDCFERASEIIQPPINTDTLAIEELILDLVPVAGSLIDRYLQEQEAVNG